MAAQRFQLNKLGFHISPTDDQLMARLRHELLSSTTDHHHHDINQNKFPLVHRYLYSDSAEPWNLFKDDDPWEISNSLESTRKIYVLTALNIVPGRNRASRGAGKGTWSGSTGEKNVKGETGSVIGTKSYFEYKIQPDPVVGHWTMYEYKLGGESYKSLETYPHAKKLVICVITHVIDKNLGFHRSWRKTPFNICYEEFKGLGLFLKKRKQHEQAEAEEEVQNKRRKTEFPTAPTTTTTEGFAKREEDQTLSIEDIEFATELGDMLGDQKDDDDDNNAKEQENQQVVMLYDHEAGGGLNDLQSCRSRAIPNLGESNFEFTQQLANSEEENYQNNNLNQLVVYNVTNQIMSPEETYYNEEGELFDVDELLRQLSECGPTELQHQWVEVDDGQLGGTDTRTNNGYSPSIINTQEQLQSSTTTTTEEFAKREENQTLTIEDREFASKLGRS